MSATAPILGEPRDFKAWSPDRDLPWARAEPLAVIRRRTRVPAFDFLARSSSWRGLPPRRREAFRIESLDWAVCQMIHGEALALETALAVSASRAPASARAAASVMAAEESLHHRAFVLYRERVLGRCGPLYADWCPALSRLIARQSRWDRKLLALQVFGERVFVDSMVRLRKACPWPVLGGLLTLVIQDEREHCLQGLELWKTPGRAGRERFILDVCRAMIGEFPADVFARAGLDAGGCLRAYRARERTTTTSTFARLLDDLPAPGFVPGSLCGAYAALELI